MKQKTKDTINELVRRERLNDKFEPITDTDIREMFRDIEFVNNDRQFARYWFFCSVILIVFLGGWFVADHIV